MSVKDVSPIVEGRCFWCAGRAIRCLHCDEVIQCRFCGGTNVLTLVQRVPRHLCPKQLQQMPVTCDIQ